ncbi:MAG: two-component system phosphate regulon response regulator PhoB [Planctomycetaceae bacterium]|jgi:two-component system phosphate regulon response regulator PhoB
MSSQTILIVEDEPSLVEVLSYNLEKEGFEVLTANNGRDGLERARSALPDLVILDLMLPLIDGLQVCAQLRGDAKTQNIRILMLTARSEETDEVVGFNVGADDYVTKPFKVRPLIHRIKALLRRNEKSKSETSILSVHGVEIDKASFEVRVDEKELELTRTEFRLLWTLMRQPGRSFSRLELMDSSRGMDANALERTIDVHVRALRKKMGDPGDLIETVRGIGYRFKRE